MLYDLTGTWDLTFYMSGVWLLVSGLCVGVIPYTRDLRMCGHGPLLKEADDEKRAEEAEETQVWYYIVGNFDDL